MLIKSDPDIIKSYLEDSSGLKGGRAELVALPESEGEIVDFLKNNNSPVTISGAGTGVTAGRVPFGGSVLSLEKLNNIINVRKYEDGTGSAVLEPGVTLKALQEELDKQDLLYPPDPTEKTAFIGGNVSTNASGGRGFKYGTTRDYVERLKIALSNGYIINVRRGQIFANGEFEIDIADDLIKIPVPKYKMPKTKNAAGYYAKSGMDLIDLFIGHEGTLGVITEVEVRLLPKPERTIHCIVFFEREMDAYRLVEDVRSKSFRTRNSKQFGLDADELEFLDIGVLDLLRESYPNIPKTAVASIIFEQEATAETIDKLMEEWERLLEKHKAILNNVWFADTEKRKQEFDDFRHSVPEKVNEIVKRTGFAKSGTDFAVPHENFTKMMEFYRSKLEHLEIHHVIFGHIGESHMHVNILPKSSEEQEKARSVYVEFVRKALELGGTVSAEHGIGKVKHKYLEMMYGRDSIKQMADLKKALDPKCILGINNIFPKELLL